MPGAIGDCNDDQLRSWVESANTPGVNFPIQNLPYGIFRRAGSNETFRGGVAIGDQILDLRSDLVRRALPSEALAAAMIAGGPSLNAFMGIGRPKQSSLRAGVSRILRHNYEGRQALRSALVPMSDAEVSLPAVVGDFADFYSSLHHARNAGALIRPQNPILPNYWWLPVGYHGRTSTIALSGHGFQRPRGQILPAGETRPVYEACRRMDYEAELGIFVGTANQAGQPISIDSADEHIFGMCLLNDWSARDIQSWEYQPLGPFLGKSFASTISPWIVTLDALEPFRVGLRREADAPGPLRHLIASDQAVRGALDIRVESRLLTKKMQARGEMPALLSSSTYADAFWSVSQLVTHYSSGGCALQPGDLLGSGTLSGPSAGSRACLLEITTGGRDPITLPGGETRTFLEDGDTIILTAHCEREGYNRIGFGECRATLLPGEA